MKSACYLFFILLFFSCSPSSQQGEDLDTNPAIFQASNLSRITTDGGQTRGVAWGDYDNDGDPDLYIANAGGQWNSLYRNEGNGSFKKITDTNTHPAAILVNRGTGTQGVNWVDYDNDGDLDLYAVSRGDEANLLFRKDDSTTFSRVLDGPLVAEGISASMACWADIEGDGDLDVVLVGYRTSPNQVFENLGGGDFRERKDVLLSAGEGAGRACACGDANDDRLPEFFIANARQTNFYYRNLGNWQFEQMQEGILVSDLGYAYGASWADYDNDGDLDIFVANFDKENLLFQNDGAGNMQAITQGNIVTEKGGASKGHSWGDYNNDGHLDLFIGNGTYRPDMQNFLYLNQGNGQFRRDTIGDFTIHADTSAGVAHADYDRDGDLDVFVANWGASDEANRFYINQTESKNWLSLRLGSEISNRFAIGSKVKIVYTQAGEKKNGYRWVYPTTGYGSQDDYEVHFGLGTATDVDSLIIDWPSGNHNIFTDLSINQHYSILENGALNVTN